MEGRYRQLSGRPENGSAWSIKRRTFKEFTLDLFAISHRATQHK
jgi:hypothetical protein